MMCSFVGTQSGLLDAFRAMGRIFLCDSGIKAEGERDGKTLRRGDFEVGVWGGFC